MKWPHRGADNLRASMLRLLVVAAAAGLSACASSGATPHPFPRQPAPPASPISTASTSRAGYGHAVAGTALSLQGIPYRNGGETPDGFDCSGFVKYVFEQHGLAVPRRVDELYRSGRAVPSGALQPGDLVFFDTAGSGASHVGIVIGGGEFVHAPSSRGVVRIDRVEGPYWAPRFAGARRLTN